MQYISLLVGGLRFGISVCIVDKGIKRLVNELSAEDFPRCPKLNVTYMYMHYKLFPTCTLAQAMRKWVGEIGNIPLEKGQSGSMYVAPYDLPPIHFLVKASRKSYTYTISTYAYTGTCGAPVLTFTVCMLTQLV